MSSVSSFYKEKNISNIDLLANHVVIVDRRQAIQAVEGLFNASKVELVADGKKEERFRIFSDVQLIGNYLGECSGFSGSQQFDPEQFSGYKNKIHQLADKHVVVNLREESFVFLKLPNGDVKTVRVLGSHEDDVNQGKNTKEIEDDERQTVDKVKKAASVVIYEISKKTNQMVEIFSGPISDAFTEKELFQKQGIPSLRLPVGDHKALPASVIDQIVALHDEGLWIHFHCCGGKGRTSQAIAILAILKWGSAKNLDQIFDELEKNGNKSLRNQGSQEDARFDPLFWKSFYDFARSEKRTRDKISWSNWLAS